MRRLRITTITIFASERSWLIKVFGVHKDTTVLGSDPPKVSRGSLTPGGGAGFEWTCREVKVGTGS